MWSIGLAAGVQWFKLGIIISLIRVCLTAIYNTQSGCAQCKVAAVYCSMKGIEPSSSSFAHVHRSVSCAYVHAGKAGKLGRHPRLGATKHIAHECGAWAGCEEGPDCLFAASQKVRLLPPSLCAPGYDYGGICGGTEDGSWVCEDLGGKQEK